MFDLRKPFHLWPIIVLAGLSLRCGRKDEAASLPKFSIGMALVEPTRGHEDLTRFAVEMANRYIKETQGLANYFTAIPVGENGGRSSLPMIEGSFDTDWAVTLVTHTPSGQTMIDFYGVGWIRSGSDWQDMPWLQSLHFLRDRDAFGRTFGLEESLDRSREKITKAFEQAVRVSWDRDQAFYWLGHVLHIVQDSFSTVHVQRSPDLRSIMNLCVFGVESVADACEHPRPVSGEGENPVTGAVFGEDRIWRSDSVNCHRNPWERGWSCLKPEAIKAIEVSAGILVLYAKIVGSGVDAPKSDGYEEITDFLVNTHHWQGGYFKGGWE